MVNTESEGKVESEGVEDEAEEATIKLASLPKEKGFFGDMYFYQGFWCPEIFFHSILYAQRHFKASDRDILLVTQPKSGTTWLKALSFAVANRHLHTPSTHPLLTSSPHTLVPFLEHKVYADRLSPVSSPPSSSTRIFSTQIPYQALPGSIESSGCRIVYLCRNPFDAFVSLWHFYCKSRARDHEPLSFEDAFNKYCKGAFGFGPFGDHILRYWEESLVQPEKILFMMFEDLIQDITPQVKRLADFIGMPFSSEEEREGAVDDVVRLCSFRNLSELEVNKTGTRAVAHFENNAFFRKGEVGDWVNYFSMEMVGRLNNVIDEKLGSSDLKFKLQR